MMMLPSACAVLAVLLTGATEVPAQSSLRLSLTLEGKPLDDLRFEYSSDLMTVAEAYLAAHPQLPAESRHPSCDQNDVACWARFLVGEMARVVQETAGSQFDHTLDINGIEPPFVVTNQGDPRAGLSGYCARHKIGAFDCATAHRAAQRIGHARLPIPERPCGGLVPATSREFESRQCDDASRAAQRIAFLRAFPVHDVDSEGFMDPSAIDRNTFGWPYSGGLEAESVDVLLGLLLGGGLGGGRLAALEDGDVPPCSVLVDVGANRGDFAALLLSVASRHQEAQQLRGKSPVSFWCVHMIEPAAEEVAQLRARFVPGRGPLSVVTVHQVAVSDGIADDVPMYFPQDTALDPFPRVHACGTLMPILYDSKFGQGRTGARFVKVVTLDSLLPGLVGPTAAVDLLKVDAEGADLMVLRGASTLLASGRVRSIIFEYGHGWVGAPDTTRVNLASTVSWLDALGFDSYLVGAGASLLKLSGGCWSGDFETWAWSNVVAVSRAAAPLAAARLDAVALVKPAPPPPCAG